MLYDIFKKTVFDWLDVISKGTNKKIIKSLMTPEGISSIFDLPVSISKKLLKNWYKKQRE